MENTSFSAVYERFLGKITDDMYIELTPEETQRDMKQLLIDSIPYFEFPRVDLYDYSSSQDEEPHFNISLTPEEINILAILMRNAWIQRQVASIENTRMKYSGPDFKMTSQANHLAKLLALLKEGNRESLHLQRLYKRRKLDSKIYESNWSVLRKSALE